MTDSGPNFVWIDPNFRCSHLSVSLPNRVSDHSGLPWIGLGRSYPHLEKNMTRLFLIMALLGFSGFAGASTQAQVSVSQDAEAFNAYLDAQQGVDADLDSIERRSCTSKYHHHKKRCSKLKGKKRHKCYKKAKHKYHRCKKHCKHKYHKKKRHCRKKKGHHKKKCHKKAHHWYKRCQSGRFAPQLAI